MRSSTMQRPPEDERWHSREAEHNGDSIDTIGFALPADRGMILKIYDGYFYQGVAVNIYGWLACASRKYSIGAFY